MRFINTLVQTAPDLNAKVSRQLEFLEAGLKPNELEQVKIISHFDSSIGIFFSSCSLYVEFTMNKFFMRLRSGKRTTLMSRHSWMTYS